MSFSIMPQNNIYSPPISMIDRRSDPYTTKNSQINKFSFSSVRPTSNYQQMQPANNYTNQSNRSYQAQDNKQSRQSNPNVKLTQMSSDLARLKQQLNRIMNQADRFDKKIVTQQKNASFTLKPSFEAFEPTYGQHQISSSQQLISQPFNTSQQLNTSQKFNTPQQGSNKNAYLRMTESPSLKTSSNQIAKSSTYLNQNQNLNNSTYAISSSNYGESKINNSVSEKNIYQYGVGSSTNYSIQPQAQSDAKYQVKRSSNGINNQPSQSFNSKINLRIKSQLNAISQNEIPKIISTQKQVKSPSQKSDKNQKSSSYSSYSNNYQLTTQTKQTAPSYTYQNLTSKGQYKTPQLSLFINFPQSQTTDIYSYSPSRAQTPSSSKKLQLINEDIVQRIVTQQMTKKISETSESQKKKKSNQQYQLQEKIIQLEHQKRKMKHQLTNTLLEKQNFQVMLQTQIQNKQTFMKKNQQLEEILKNNKRQLEQYKDKYKVLQRKFEAQISKNRSKISMSQQQSFDQALKSQIKQINVYKDKIQLKDEQIMRLKQGATYHRRQVQSLNNQIKVQQLKSISLLNQSQQKREINLQDKSNQIKTLKNLVSTLQAKIAVAIRENKTKDNFMVQHLTGKAKTPEEKHYIENFFKKFQLEFPIDKLGDKLKEEHAEIQRLKATILQMVNHV